ncbi:MAG: hypothetical protein M3463_23845, partial [Verrucomicrobiota bacterium]|nr:hypothetical protein [Verrucomicrobiota bacterium]
HPLTGRIVTRAGPDSVREKFRRDLLPAAESPEDYDEEGRVKLGPAYHSWLASGHHGLHGRVGAQAREELVRVVSPVPGTMFVVDPDLPTSRRVPLQAQGSERLEWKSRTLECRVGDGRAYALVREGEHEIEVHDPLTGAVARTWIRVKAL